MKKIIHSNFSNPMLDKTNQIIEYEEKCKQAIKVSLRTTVETTALSNQAAAQLHEQSEKLKKVETDIESVGHNLETSEYLINGMKSWWGGFMQYFTTNPEACTSQISTHSSNMNTTVTHSFPSNCQKHYKKDHFLNETDEFEDNIEELSTMLNDLHTQAKQVGEVLHSHNVLLHRIQEKVLENEEKMSTQQKMLNAMLYTKK